MMRPLPLSPRPQAPRTPPAAERRARALIFVFLCIAPLLTGCRVSPEPADQADFLTRAVAQSVWFERTVPGLRQQIKASAAYIVFPDAAQWGTLMGGGSWARGAVFSPSRKHLGWMLVNGSGLGIQAGFSGYDMLIVVQDDPTLRALQDNQWNAGASAVGVLGTVGGSGARRFENGLAIYHASNTGLMAGLSVNVTWIQYEHAH